MTKSAPAAEYESLDDDDLLDDADEPVAIDCRLDSENSIEFSLR